MITRTLILHLLCGALLAAPAGLASQQVIGAENPEALRSEAWRLLRDDDPAVVQRGIELLKEAASAYRQRGNEVLERMTLQDVGMRYLDLQEPDSAVAYYRRALLADPFNHGRGESAAGLGIAFRAAGRPDSAITYLHVALADLRTRLNNAPRRTEAVEWEPSLLYPVNPGLQSPEGELLYQLGSAFHAAGIRDSSRSYFSVAFPLLAPWMQAQHARMPLWDPMSYTPLRLLYSAIGHFRLARGQYGRLAYYEWLPGASLLEDLEIVREVKDPFKEAAILTRIATHYQSANRVDSAAVYFRAAMEVHQLLGDEAAMGRARSVLASLERGPPSARQPAPSPGSQQGREAGGATDLGALRQAVMERRRALDRGGEVEALVQLAQAHEREAQRDSALASYQAAAVSGNWTGADPWMRAAVFTAIARLHHRGSRQPDLRQATAYYDSATAATHHGLNLLRGEQNYMGIAEQDTDVFGEWALAWLARAQTDGPRRSAAAALAAIERGRSRVLFRLMVPEIGTPWEIVPYGTVRAGDVEEEDGKGERLISRFWSSAISELRFHETPPWEKAALSYFATADTLLIWLVLPTQPEGEINVARRAVSRDSLSSLVARVRSGFSADSARGQRLPNAERNRGFGSATSEEENAALQALSDLLLPGELLRRIPYAGDLTIVPHGPLNLLPFAALQPIGWENPLGIRYALRYLPSFEIGASLHTAKNQLAQADALIHPVAVRRERALTLQRSLVIANPLMPGGRAGSGSEDALGFDPLPGAEREGVWVAGKLGVTPLLGDSATETAVRGRIAGAALIHLATHGLAYGSPARTRESFVVLAADDAHDGFLRVADVFDELPHLSANLVVLSACQTGLGSLSDAEGTLGFQRAFLAKGAQSVLVSLWSVSDDATSALMESFYVHWLDSSDILSKAEALRRAQAEVRRTPGFEHPRYWAAFQLVGAG